MTRTIYTFNQFHLGDNLVFLHLLRALAKPRPGTPFVHFCHAHLLPQLQEAVADLLNISLEPFESPLWKHKQNEAVDTWKNTEGYWEESAHRWEWSRFMLQHHAWTAMRMGMATPFSCVEHLLFDYPALEKVVEEPARDFLVIDAEPHSGQLKPMAKHGSGYLDQFIALLRNSGYDVRTTSACKKDGYTITQIGALALKCRHVVGVMTGPAWPCISTTRHHLTSEGRRTIFLLDNGEKLGLPGVEQCANVEELLEIARKEGWL